jgi:hypothetical protein
MIITPPFSSFSVVFSNKSFRNCSSTVDVGFVKLSSDWFCGNRDFNMNIDRVLLLPLLQQLNDF